MSPVGNHIVGLCAVTYNRPTYAEKSLRAAAKHLAGIVDHTVIVNDGSDVKYAGAYKRAFQKAMPLNPCIMDAEVNRGVATAKNMGLSYLLEQTDSDYLFVLEDDIVIKAPEAVSEYVRIAEKHGVATLSMAHHGPANLGVPLGEGDITYYPHSIGAWVLYRRDALEKCGIFDETFNCAWEHVELSLRLAAASYAGGAAYNYADVTKSGDYLAEIPGAIEKSSIRGKSDWGSAIRDGLIHWKESKRDTFDMLFGQGQPLEHYAHRIIGE